jgi:hypothetical protein
MALKTGTKEDIDAARRGWVDKALAFCLEKTGEDSTTENKTKLHRMKSFAWLVAAEYQMKQCCGISGWLHFQTRKLPSDPFPASPGKWPSITILSDQGSDGVCAQNFLAYHLGINILILKDTAHRVWNDTCLALKECRLWFVIIAFNAVCCCDHGPWQDSRWYTEACEAASAYDKLCSPEMCPIFEQNFEKIVLDLQPHDSFMDTSDPSIVFASIKEAWSQKLPKVATSRWFAIFDALETLDSRWHRRLVTLLFICLSEGWMGQKTARSVKLSEALAGAACSDDGPKSTSKESTELKALKQHCQNNLHFCCSLLLDDDYQSLLRGLRAVVAPIRLHHGMALKYNRSTAMVVAWYIDQSSGACLKPLQDVIKVLRSREMWSQLGLWCNGKLPHDAATVDAKTINDNELMTKVIEFAKALVSRRMREVTWATRGWPGSFPALLNSDLAQGALHRLRDDYMLYAREVKTKIGASWNMVKKRSVFHYVCVQQVTNAVSMLELGVSGWLG